MAPFSRVVKKASIVSISRVSASPTKLQPNYRNAQQETFFTTLLALPTRYVV